MPLRILGALALALLLFRPRRGVGGYRAAVYLPTIIPDVAFALIWLWIFNPLYGPVNQALGALGLPDAGLARGRVHGTLPLRDHGALPDRRGLRDPPGCPAGPAARDVRRRRRGRRRTAGRTFRYLTLPLLMPWLVLLTFRDIILSFQLTFTPSFVMTGGDPYYATLFLPLLIYEEAFDRFRFGPGSALMLLVFLASAALILATWWLFRRRGYTGDV